MSALRRTTPLTVAGLLGLALLTPAYAATAAAETCRGEAATVVGSRGSTAVGTEGRDVVVTNGTSNVRTLGGDDLVCITGRDASDPRTQFGVNVDTGPGDDVVDGTAADSWSADVDLGAGADRFEGGGADDYVYAGAVTVQGSDVTWTDADVDVLIGGGGADSLSGGEVGLPDSDERRGGDGSDGISSRGELTDAAVLDGGAGRDHVGFVLLAGANVLDNVSEQLRRDDTVVARWASMEHFFLSDPKAGAATIDIRGSGADETFWTTGGSPVVADLGGGDDELAVPALLPAGSRVVGGEGQDRFDFGTEDHDIDWDLREDSVQVDDGRTIPVTGIEDAFVSAPRVRLTGTDGPNTLGVNTCDGRLDGRGGRDSLHLSSDFVFEEFDSCAETMVFLGGGGNDMIGSRAGAVDRMVGGGGDDTFDSRGGDDVVLGGPGLDRAELGNGRDVFRGGPGRDRVDGQQDRDLCRAERRTSCER